MNRHTTGRRRSRHLLPAVRVFVLLTFVAVAVSADEGPIEIQVLADRDGGRLNPIYRDFAQGGESPDPEYYAPVWPQFERLRPRTVRFDHQLPSSDAP